MISVRLMGEPDEVTHAVRALSTVGRVLSESRPYPCRGADARVRVYLDIETTPQTPEAR